jgi:hypothetical protein
MLDRLISLYKKSKAKNDDNQLIAFCIKNNIDYSKMKTILERTDVGLHIRAITPKNIVA